MIAGRVSSCRGAPECVRPLVLRTVQLFEPSPREPAAGWAELLLRLAQSLNEIKELDRAEDLYNRGVQLFESSPRGPSGRAATEVISSVLSFADSCWGTCAADRALRILHRAVQLFESLWPTAHQEARGRPELSVPPTSEIPVEEPPPAGTIPEEIARR